MSLDLTLNSILIPAFKNYTPPFGQKVTVGIDPYTGENNKGGLNTKQVNDNIIASFVKMRAVTVSESVTTTSIEYDAKLFISASSSITLTLANASYAGCRITIINDANYDHTLSYNDISSGSTVVKASTILKNAIIKIVWTGTTWQNITAPAVGKTIEQYPLEKAPSVIYPCTTWEEVTKFDGAFFRAAGGNASDFIEEGETLTPQEDATAAGGLTFTGIRKQSSNQTANPSLTISGKHTHLLNLKMSTTIGSFPPAISGYGKWTSLNGTVGINNMNTSYCFTGIDPGTSINNASLSGNHKHTFTAEGDITSADDETRPPNLTYKLWKRTA